MTSITKAITATDDKLKEMFPNLIKHILYYPTPESHTIAAISFFMGFHLEFKFEITETEQITVFTSMTDPAVLNIQKVMGLPDAIIAHVKGFLDENKDIITKGLESNGVKIS